MWHTVLITADFIVTGHRAWETAALVRCCSFLCAATHCWLCPHYVRLAEGSHDRFLSHRWGWEWWPPVLQPRCRNIGWCTAECTDFFTESEILYSVSACMGYNCVDARKYDTLQVFVNVQIWPSLSYHNCRFSLSFFCFFSDVDFYKVLHNSFCSTQYVVSIVCCCASYQ